MPTLLLVIGPLILTEQLHPNNITPLPLNLKETSLRLRYIA